MNDKHDLVMPHLYLLMDNLEAKRLEKAPLHADEVGQGTRIICFFQYFLNLDR